jgi:hypothetical protein
MGLRQAFSERVKGLGIREIRTALRAPTMKDYVSYCTSLV